MPKPHSYLGHVQADVIAECWEDVPRDLYAALWNDIVPLYDGQPRGECPGEFTYPITSYWGHLSEDHQRTLNALAKREQEYS